MKYKFLKCHKINYKHGGEGTKLYSRYSSMKDRCLNPNSKDYHNYGGRGITICEEWLNKKTGFIKFRNWSLSNGYKENLQINRIKNNLEYSPNNCNWVIAKENSRNRRNQKIKDIEMANEIRIKYKTGNYTQKELAEKYNVSISYIPDIIHNRRWRIKDA